MKARELLEQDRDYCLSINNDKSFIKQYDDAIKELEALQKQIIYLDEFVRVANRHIEFYRCKCGALGRVGYLCSNKECTEQ